MKIEFLNLQRDFRIPTTKLRSLAKRSCPALGLGTAVVFVFVSSVQMRRLNKQFLKHDYPTDVITFQEGEIVICPAQARANARRYKTSYEREISLYAVHGLLHLAGYDDHNPRDIKRMRAMEKKLLGDTSVRTC